jgi:hypothetical protein
VYWAENLIVSLLIGVRVAVHRRVTRKRGHQGGFLANFMLVALAFTVAHGVFLAALLGGALVASPIDMLEVASGVRWMLGVQIGALIFDLIVLRTWPFAEVRKRTEWLTGRVVVVHMGILGGMFWMAARGAPSSFFAIFIGLKTLADVGSLLPQYDPQEAPKWMARIASRFPSTKEEESFEEYWRKHHQGESHKRVRDEETLPELRA